MEHSFSMEMGQSLRKIQTQAKYFRRAERATEMDPVPEISPFKKRSHQEGMGSLKIDFQERQEPWAGVLT
jgi:hypothetical protein